MPVATSGNRGGWFSAVTVLLMDRGNTPLSIEELVKLAARRVGPTARNDGYVTAGKNGHDEKTYSYEAGWKIIVEELVTLLRERGYVDGDLRWIGATDGQISWGGTKYSIRNAGERQERRDFHMVTLGSKADYGEVQVLGARGGITRRRLEVHPLADLLPQIPKKELAELRKDIDENGVLVPLLMFEDKVLDGRHRLYLATVLGKPVHLETFEGTETEARARVGSLNLRRRHLDSAQRTQMAIDLYQAEAEKEAKEAQKRKPSVSPEPEKQTKPKHTSKLVADKAGGAVTPHAVQAMQVVQEAPETLAAVRAGEIPTVSEAERKAREELEDAPPKVGAWKTTVNREFGQILGHLATIREGLELGAVADPAEIRDRGEKIITEMREILDELERRSAI